MAHFLAFFCGESLAAAHSEISGGALRKQRKCTPNLVAVNNNVGRSADKSQNIIDICKNTTDIFTNSIDIPTNINDILSFFGTQTEFDGHGG